jgi:hypothetical protein
MEEFDRLEKAYNILYNILNNTELNNYQQYLLDEAMDLIYLERRKRGVI